MSVQYGKGPVVGAWDITVNRIQISLSARVQGEIDFKNSHKNKYIIYHVRKLQVLWGSGEKWSRIKGSGAWVGDCDLE